MKKFRFGLIGLVLIAIATLIAAAGVASAAAVVDTDNIHSTETGKHIVVPIAVTGDTNSVALTLANHPYLEGRLFFGFESEPGADDAAPSAAFDVSITSAHWSLAWTALSHTANDYKAFNTATGDIENYPMVTGTVTVAIGNLGADNTATINLIFW